MVIENKMMQGMRAVLKMTTVTTGACCCKDSANQDRGSTARETLTWCIQKTYRRNSVKTTSMAL